MEELADSPAPPPAAAAATAMSDSITADGAQAPVRTGVRQRERQQQQEQQATAAAARTRAYPAKTSGGAAPVATEAANYGGLGVWVARLEELAQAAQQTAVRLQRQLDPPPPGFPPGTAIL